MLRRAEWAAFALAGLLSGIAGPTGAQEVSGIEIVDYGIYTADVEETIKDPSGVDRDIIKNICHVATTSTIPASAGVLFGFRYKLLGVEEGRTVQIRVTLRFPAAVKPPGAPRALSELDETKQARIGAAGYTGYSFDHAWEMMRGRWRSGIWQGDRRVGGKDFDVVDGTGVPAPSEKGSNCFKVSRFEGPTTMRRGGMP